MADKARADAEGRLEPAAIAFSTNDEERTGLSIAISLKRIADTLEGNPSRYGLNDLVESIKEAAR